jgi:hypothetical protein
VFSIFRCVTSTLSIHSFSHPPTHFYLTMRPVVSSHLMRSALGVRGIASASASASASHAYALPGPPRPGPPPAAGPSRPPTPAPAALAGPNPATTTTPDLPPEARRLLEEIVRVDHAGELGANWIYRGQKWGSQMRGDRATAAQVEVSNKQPFTTGRDGADIAGHVGERAAPPQRPHTHGCAAPCSPHRAVPRLARVGVGDRRGDCADG